MTLIYLNATKDGQPVQFSFYADHLDILFNSDKITKAFRKRHPEYEAGDLQYTKAKVKEIRTKLIGEGKLIKFQ